MKTQEPADAQTRYREQRGAMLLAVAALLFSLTTVALLALQSARSGFYRSIDLERRAQATYAAEAGLNYGGLELSELGTVSDLELPYTLVPTTVIGEGSFAVEILNNEDDAGGAEDTDLIVILRSTGYSQGQARHRVIESRVVLSESPEPIPGALAIGANIPMEIKGANTFNGNDSEDPSKSVAGVAFEQVGQSFSVYDGGSTVTGSPDWSYADSSFTDGAGLCARARQAAAALSVLDQAHHITDANKNMSGTFGTVDAPQITVIDAGVKGHVFQEASGVGVLIVKGELKNTKDFDFQGLIIVDSDTGSFLVKKEATITGALLFTAPTAGTPDNYVLEVKGAGLLTLNYSYSAYQWAMAQLPSIVIKSYEVTN